VNDVVLLGKALADPTRVRILHALLSSEMCVCELVDALEMGQSTLSAHLQTIRQAGIVETTRRHKMVSYALTEAAREILEPVFRFHEPAMLADKRMQRDVSRIHARLELREKGICVLGPGQLDQAKEEKQ